VTEEVFSGIVPPESGLSPPIKATASPIFSPGDRWLFYLQSDDKTNELFLTYGSPSGPVADSQKSIATLRRLAQLRIQGLSGDT